MRPLLLALPLLALAAPPAAAQQKGAAAGGRWQEIGRTSEGTVVFLDTRSLRRHGDTVTATYRGVFATPKQTPQGAVTTSRTTLSLDCRGRKVAIRENTYFHDERANRVYQRRVVGIPGWGPLMGGSVPDVAFAHDCR